MIAVSRLFSQAAPASSTSFSAPNGAFGAVLALASAATETSPAMPASGQPAMEEQPAAQGQQPQRNAAFLQSAAAFPDQTLPSAQEPEPGTPAGTQEGRNPASAALPGPLQQIPQEGVQSVPLAAADAPQENARPALAAPTATLPTSEPAQRSPQTPVDVQQNLFLVKQITPQPVTKTLPSQDAADPQAGTPILPTASLQDVPAATPPAPAAGPVPSPEMPSPGQNKDQVLADQSQPEITLPEFTHPTLTGRGESAEPLPPAPPAGSSGQMTTDDNEENLMALPLATKDMPPAPAVAPTVQQIPAGTAAAPPAQPAPRTESGKAAVPGTKQNVSASAAGQPTAEQGTTAPAPAAQLASGAPSTLPVAPATPLPADSADDTTPAVQPVTADTDPAGNRRPLPAVLPPVPGVPPTIGSDHVPTAAPTAATAGTADPLTPVAAVPATVTPAPATAQAAQPATPATPAPAPAPAPVNVPVHTQLAAPLFSLSLAQPGNHVMTLAVTPEEFGPVTVRAVIGSEGVKMELFASTDAGRDALRAAMTDLRRDLAGQGMNASLDLSSRDQPEHHSGNQRENPFTRDRQDPPALLRTSETDLPGHAPGPDRRMYNQGPTLDVLA